MKTFLTTLKNALPNPRLKSSDVHMPFFHLLPQCCQPGQRTPYRCRQQAPDTKSSVEDHPRIHHSYAPSTEHSDIKTCQKTNFSGLLRTPVILVLFKNARSQFWSKMHAVMVSIKLSEILKVFKFSHEFQGNLCQLCYLVVW